VYDEEIARKDNWRLQIRRKGGTPADERTYSRKT
jgi:hypothetical protein